MSNDRYQVIRAALAMGPTPGPFSAVRSYSHGNQELIIRLTCNDEYGITENYCTVHNRLGDERKTEADAAHIAACDPDTIRALLAERDALAAGVERLTEALRRYGVHDQACSAMDIPICTCGLDAMLKARENSND